MEPVTIDCVLGVFCAWRYGSIGLQAGTWRAHGVNAG